MTESKLTSQPEEAVAAAIDAAEEILDPEPEKPRLLVENHSPDITVADLRDVLANGRRALRPRSTCPSRVRSKPKGHGGEDDDTRRPRAYGAQALPALRDKERRRRKKCAFSARSSR